MYTRRHTMQTTNNQPATDKRTEIFSAYNTITANDAHIKARAFMARKQDEGFICYESTHGAYGFSVTYWPR